MSRDQETGKKKTPSNLEIADLELLRVFPAGEFSLLAALSPPAGADASNVVELSCESNSSSFVTAAKLQSNKNGESLKRYNGPRPFFFCLLLVLRVELPSLGVAERLLELL
jgi:hypothetical protein